MEENSVPFPEVLPFVFQTRLLELQGSTRQMNGEKEGEGKIRFGLALCEKVIN